MTRPTPIAAIAPAYTREALEARVQGTVIAKCVVTTSGALTGCRIVKGVPHMDQAVLSALAASKYQPATLQGKPVSVDYIFTIRLVLP
ncbi:MAG: energy transducer TonB [Byssovorax sp.]